MNDLTGASHGAGSAGQTLVGENEGAVFRYLNGSGRTCLFTQTTTDTGYVAHMETTGILIGAQDDNGVCLYTQVDDTLGTSTVTGTATDTLALIYLGYTIGVDVNGAETAHIDTGTATGTAVLTHFGSVFSGFGTATAVTVDTGDFLGEFFLNDHGATSFIGVRRAYR